MKRYTFIWIISTSIMLSALSCSEAEHNDDNIADTTATTIPVTTTESSIGKPDTAMVPRVDPALDSAAKEKDEDLPAK